VTGGEEKVVEFQHKLC